jgi:alpha/beta hydrolase fold
MSSALASSELLYFTERGSGPPLLLVHGLMVTGEMFEPVIEHLSTRHRVIVPDLRGHGRSRGLPPPYTAAQLSCAARHSRSTGGAGKVTLRPVPLRRSQTAKPTNFNSASGPSPKCSSASANLPGGVPMALEIN